MLYSLIYPLLAQYTTLYHCCILYTSAAHVPLCIVRSASISCLHFSLVYHTYLRRQLSHPPLQLRDLSQLNIQFLLLILQLESLIGIELRKDEITLSIELQDVGVVLPQTAAMTDRHEGNAQRLGVVIHDLFGFEGDAAGALVENGILGPMVEQARHGDLLLQSTGENIAPFGFGIPSFIVEVDEVFQSKNLEDVKEVSVSDAAGAHLAQRVGVDDLLAERAARQVRSLGDVEDGAEGGLVDGAAVDGPQAAEDAEEGGLAAAVGADDEQVVAVLEGEGEFLDEDVAVGGDDGDVDEGDVFAFVDGAAALEDGFVVFCAGGGDEFLLKVARLNVVHDVEEGGDTRCVACQFHDFTVRKHHATERIGSRKQHAAIRDECLRAITHVHSTGDLAG